MIHIFAKNEILLLQITVNSVVKPRRSINKYEIINKDNRVNQIAQLLDYWQVLVIVAGVTPEKIW